MTETQRTPAELLAAVTALRVQADIAPAADTTESRVFDHMEVLAHLDVIGRAALLPLLAATVDLDHQFLHPLYDEARPPVGWVKRFRDQLDESYAAVDAALGADGA